jgi:hypothetical protein
MVTKSKKILAIILALFMGVTMTWMGVRDLRNSILLSKRGLNTVAEVIDGHETVSGRSRTHSYYLTLLFQPQGGSNTRKDVKVSEADYANGLASGSIKVFYLPEDPTICMAGNVVDIKYGNLLFGLGMFGVAWLLFAMLKIPVEHEEMVDTIQERFEPMTYDRHEYLEADASKFKHLDLAFYNQAQRQLEQRGFQFLGDFENATLRKTLPAPVLIRHMLSRDKTTMACIYHFKPSFVQQLLSAKQAKVIDCESWFSNGSFVCTSNAEMAGKLDSPPQVDSLFLPGATPCDAVVEAHQRRISNFSAKHPGVTPVELRDLHDVRRAQNELQWIKAQFRRKAGISKDEIARIAGHSGSSVETLHAELAARMASPVRK